MNNKFSRRSFFTKGAAISAALTTGLPSVINPVVANAEENAKSLPSSQVPLNLTFTEEDSLSIIAGNTCLVRKGQLYAAWRYPGAQNWTQETCAYPAHDRSDGQADVNVKMGPLTVTIQIRRIAPNVFEFSGKLRNTGKDPVELARFHYFHGDHADRAHKMLLPCEGGRLAFPGETSTPLKDRLEEGWRNNLVSWPRLADPLHMESNWTTSTDVVVVQRDYDSEGLLIGFTGPGNAFGEIGIGGSRLPIVTLYAGMLLDNVLLKPGKTRTLDRCILVYGDWQDDLKFWAHRCATEFDAKLPGAPLTGYCSWYQVFSGVKAEHIQQATKEYAAWPTPLGGKTIQIDDGFQVMPGDWGPNEKFKEEWKTLPGEIAASGSIPGLWLAPHAIYYKHPVVTEHPDWIQRLADGSPAISFSNWGWCEQPPLGDKPPTSRPTYFLDPDHPGARKFMRKIIKDAVAQGWKYLKIDFTYAVTTARVSYDRSKTNMESLRGMFELFRDAAGPNILICACIGTMGRYALGHADTARLGGDTTGNWESIRANLPGLFQRYCTNAIWWQGDPDVFHMRENPSLTSEETWLHTGTLGLLGGVFLSSDVPSQWSEEARRRVALFFNKTGPRPPAMWRVAYDAPTGLPKALRVSYDRGAAPRHQIGLYNWDDKPQTVRVSLASLRLSASDVVRIKETLPGTPSILVEGDALVCQNQPPHSLRIATVE